VAAGDGMSRATAARAAGGIVCLVLAVAAVLLARDTWHVHSALVDGDLRAAVTPVDQKTWSADTTVPFDLGSRLLGVRDDLAFRQLVARAHAVSAPPANPQAQRRRAPIEEALAVTESDPDHVRASEAANVLGVLYSSDPSLPGRPAAEKALAEFTNAVRLDPNNETAKANLELLLQQSSGDMLRGRKGAASGELPGNNGAGLRAGGNGY
jgi:hypothetical protein